MLQEVLNSLCLEELARVHGVHVCEKLVIECSAAACREYFSRWRSVDSKTHTRASEDATAGTKHIVFVHFGVGSKRQKCVKLERCAYNAANFRIPDQKHWQPCKKCIDSSRPYDEAVPGDLGISKLVHIMRSQGMHPSNGPVVLLNELCS